LREDVVQHGCRGRLSIAPRHAQQAAATSLDEQCDFTGNGNARLANVLKQRMIGSQGRRGNEEIGSSEVAFGVPAQP
jgi:hypothetical protein